MERSRAEELLKETTHTYDAISHHFSKTRYAAGSWLASLTKTVSKNDSVLDIGCGNGRLLDALPEEVEYTGIDVSEQLIGEARKKYSKHALDFKAFDGMHIPFPDRSFSAVYMLAAFHHIPKPLQQPFMNECYRVLSDHGRLVLTAWHLWRQPFLGYLLHSFRDKNKLDFFDIYVPWKNQQKQLGKRYFHMLRKRELTRLAKKAGFIDVGCKIKSLAAQKNYLLTAKK